MSHKRKYVKRKSRKVKSRKGSRKSTRNSRKSFCNKKLKNKIGINMSEWKKGRFSSRSQALAVSYAQVKKSNPKCSRYFRKSKK